MRMEKVFICAIGWVISRGHLYTKFYISPNIFASFMIIRLNMFASGDTINR